MGDDEGPGFAYTTGFWLTARQPELLMFGLKMETAHQVFTELFRDAQAGRSPPVGVRGADIFENQPTYAFNVDRRHYADHLGWSRWFYRGDDFPCLQVVWPDRAGMFPWEKGFNTAFANEQRDLAERGWTRSLAHSTSLKVSVTEQ